ncbi:hypothetical protein GCM10023078_11970 [Gibbsiella greigii]
MLEEIEKTLMVVKADIGDRGRPLAVNLLLGPTGVGKTETVRLIAEGIYGDRHALCRIDMNTLSQAHYTAAISGAPPGYVGSREETTLLEAAKIEGSFSKPGIVLFDEIEKADESVILSLLNILDSGELTLSSGKTRINFCNCMIFMTSNIGYRDIKPQNRHGAVSWLALLARWQKKETERERLRRVMRRHFAPEFINRLDRVLIHQVISAEQLISLVDIEVEKLCQRLQRHGITFSLRPTAKVLLCRHYDADYGAREISRQIRTQCEPLLSEAILTFPDCAHFIIDAEDDTFSVIAQPLHAG